MNENHNPFVTKKSVGSFFVSAVVVVLALGCSKKEEIKCADPEPAPQKAESDKTREPLSMLGVGNKNPNADWCRTCVMGPKGWASCQTVYAENKNDSRDAIKARSREKACDDAGFEKGQCPDKAVLGATCKGDKPPAGNEEAAKAMQAIFFKGKDIKPELTGEAEKPAEQKSEEAQAPKPAEEKR